MPKIDVTWTRTTPEGEKLQVSARTRGDRWIFFTRSKRFEDWKEVAAPPLEDWLELLDGVRRRGGRHLASAKDEARLMAQIRKLFPAADLGRKSP